MGHHAFHPTFARAVRGLRAAWPVSVLAAMAVVAGACGSTSTNLVSPTADKCQVSVTGFTGAFGAGGGTGSATIATSRDCSWSATTPDSGWISLAAPAAGQGEATLRFVVSPNQAPSARTGAIAVNGQRMSVTQDPAPCRFSISPESQRVPAVGMRGTITVSTMDGCAWTAAASPSASWVSVEGTGRGSGTDTIAYTVRANSDAARQTTLLVAGLAFTIQQDGPAAAPPAPAPPDPPAPPPPTPPPPTPPPPTPPPPSCVFSASPTALTFDAAGGSAAVTVATTAACSWQATESATWLTLSSGTGKGPGAVTVTADPNTGAARSSSVVVAGSTIGVSQAAAPPPPPSVTISGAVTNLAGSCPAITFELSGMLVLTSSSTAFSGGPCKDISEGMTVTVDGLQVSPTDVQATRVTLPKR